jgi:hypothetical protein
MFPRESAAGWRWAAQPGGAAGGAAGPEAAHHLLPSQETEDGAPGDLICAPLMSSYCSKTRCKMNPKKGLRVEEALSGEASQAAQPQATVSTMCRAMDVPIQEDATTTESSAL